MLDTNRELVSGKFDFMQAGIALGVDLRGSCEVKNIERRRTLDGIPLIKRRKTDPGYRNFRNL